jgi:hypothetical protein
VGGDGQERRTRRKRVPGHVAVVESRHAGREDRKEWAPESSVRQTRDERLVEDHAGG